MYKRNAFTLVELSIVIVIIALIISGVTASKSLIKEAKLRGVITDLNKYQTAVNTFKTQYNYMPGDLPNAASYWSSCTNSGGNSCNGNGDKKLLSYEPLRFWQHLGLSGLIPGSYTGLVAGATYFKIGENAPASSIPGATFGAWQTQGGLPNVHGVTGAMLYFGGPYTDLIYTPVLNTPEAVSIDKKIDDGRASTGKIYGINGYVNSWGTSTGCVTGNNQSTTATYDMTNTRTLCSLIYFLERN